MVMLSIFQRIYELSKSMRLWTGIFLLLVIFRVVVLLVVWFSICSLPSATGATFILLLLFIYRRPAYSHALENISNLTLTKHTALPSTLASSWTLLLLHSKLIPSLKTQQSEMIFSSAEH